MKTNNPDKNERNTIPYFAVNDSFDIVYRNSSTSSPVVPHTHNALELFFTLTDLPDVLLADTVSSVAKGSLIVIPPHCVHQLFNQQLVYERYIVTINTIWLRTVFSSHPQLIHYACSSEQPYIIMLLPEKQNELCKKLKLFLDSKSEVTVNTYAEFFDLLSFFDVTIEQYKVQESNIHYTISQSQETVNNIIAYINENLTEPITLSGIADYFFMNKDYLARLFKKHTHSTIGYYISMQRASMAQSLLADGLTVSQVQEKMGFSSYAYFFKFFKKMTGMSPSRYRNMKSNNQITKTLSID